MRNQSWRSVAALALVVAAYFAAYAHAQAQADAKAASVMADVRKALGGEQKIAAMKGLSLRADYRREMSAGPGGGGSMTFVMMGGGGARERESADDRQDRDRSRPSGQVPAHRHRERRVWHDAHRGLRSVAAVSRGRPEHPGHAHPDRQPGVRPRARQGGAEAQSDRSRAPVSRPDRRHAARLRRDVCIRRPGRVAGRQGGHHRRHRARRVQGALVCRRRDAPAADADLHGARSHEWSCGR